MSTTFDLNSRNNLRNLAANSTVITIFQIVGNSFALIFFVTPFFQIIKKQLYSERQAIRDMPLLLILTIIFNCLLWLLNAFSSENISAWIPLLVSNIGGLAVNTLLLFFYLFIYLNKRVKQFLGFGFFVVDLLIEVTYLTYRYIIKKSEGTDSAFHLIGFVATIINVIMYLSPIQNIKIIIKQRKYQALPIYTLIIGFFSTLTFFTQGVISYLGADDNNEKRNAVETMISNGVSFFLLACLVGIYSYFYFTQPKNASNIDNGNDNEELNKNSNNITETSD
jgi:hypothetical protein